MTLFQKDFNVDKMLAELKTPYDDIPKHKLRKLLIERDEEITTHIAEIRTLEKSDRLLEMAKRKLKKLNKENKELKTNRRDAHTEHHRREQGWYSSYKIKTEDIDKLQAENKELKEKLKKLNREINSIKEEWSTATHKIATENSELHNEIKDLKQELRASHQVSAVHIKRATELTSMEMEIDKVCSRIQTPDDLGHLMGNTENKELKEQIEINSKLYKSLEKSNEMKVKTLQTEIKCMELRHDYTMEYIQEWDSIHDWREELEEKAHKRGTWDEIMVFFDD